MLTGWQEKPVERRKMSNADRKGERMSNAGKGGNVSKVKRIPLHFELNKKKVETEAKPNDTLLDILRDNLGTKSVKRGCEVGECGACTVLLDDEPVLSCIILALSIEGKKVTTLEGISSDGLLHPVQQAFLQEGAVQCGYCTPGMMLVAKALLDRNPSPCEEEIKEAIEGNLCRCTGYQKIIRAIKKASEKMLEEESKSVKRKE
jgi:carbon-monoxide dehydrogenase small subunit